MPISLPALVKPCNCVGPCAGYGSSRSCPPLIVLAVLAVQQAAMHGGLVTIGGIR